MLIYTLNNVLTLWYIYMLYSFVYTL